MIIIRIMYLVMGTLLGFFIAMVIWGPHSHNLPECVVGKVQTVMKDTIIIIGEAVVCGEFHSSIYGPTLEAWDGPIKFYHNHDEE